MFNNLYLISQCQVCPIIAIATRVLKMVRNNGPICLERKHFFAFGCTFSANVIVSLNTSEDCIMHSKQDMKKVLAKSVSMPTAIMCPVFKI